MSDVFGYALTNRGLPPLPDWQRALDRWDLLVPVRLRSVYVGDNQLSSLYIDEHEVNFACAKADPQVLLSEKFPDLRTSWSSAYGFRGFDQHRQLYAAAVACISCVLAVDGAYFGLGHPPTPDPSKFRRDMDLFLTSSLNRDELFYARYPEERPTGLHDGPVTIETRLLRD